MRIKLYSTNSHDTRGFAEVYSTYTSHVQMDAEITYDIACVILLILLIIFKGRPLLVIALWVPAMSHVYHILFGEGFYRDNAPWYNSYEIAVFAEVLLLRGITTFLLRKHPYVVYSAAGIALASMLPFLTEKSAGVYNWTALGLDALLLTNTLLGDS